MDTATADECGFVRMNAATADGGGVTQITQLLDPGEEGGSLRVQEKMME